MKDIRTKKFGIISVMFLVIVLLIVLFVNLGIIVLPKSGYILYFNFNKKSFEEIVEYVETSDTHLAVDYSDLENDISTIADQNVCSEVKSLVKSPFFQSIYGKKKTYTVDNKEVELAKVNFQINNLFNLNNTSLSIIYSPTQVYDAGYYEDRDYYLSYEQIDDNWYIETITYKSEKKTDSFHYKP